MHDLRQLIEMPSYRAQVTYLPREVLEDDLELPSMPPLLGVNAPPPPLHRTPSRDGLHRAPGALGPGPPPPAQSGRAISLPALHLRGYVVTRIGREHQRRGQACEDVADWRAPLVENSAAANAFAWPPGPMSQSASLAIAAANSKHVLSRATEQHAQQQQRKYLRSGTLDSRLLHGGGGGDSSGLLQTWQPLADTGVRDVTQSEEQHHQRRRPDHSLPSSGAESASAPASDVSVAEGVHMALSLLASTCLNLVGLPLCDMCVPCSGPQPRDYMIDCRRGPRRR